VVGASERASITESFTQRNVSVGTAVLQEPDISALIPEEHVGVTEQLNRFDFTVLQVLGEGEWVPVIR
jgi:hypothetical protein